MSYQLGPISTTGSSVTISGSINFADVLDLNYNNNNAALNAGIPVGGVYRNGNTMAIATQALLPSQSAYTAIVRSIYPSASLVETWGTYTVNYIKQKSGLEPYQVLYALGICSDDVDAFTVNGNLGQYPTTMATFLGPFYCGGLAGYPFVGNVGFGAFASHITDTGSLFISCTPHIGITITGSAGYQFRKGQAAISTNCGAVHGAVGWARTATTPPTFSVSATAAVSASVFGAENYELFRLAQIIYPYKTSLTGSQSQDVILGTRLIRDAGWQYTYNNSGSFSASLAGRTMYAIGGTFINPDHGYQAYIQVNQFQAYNSTTNTWTDFTQDYINGLYAQG